MIIYVKNGNVLWTHPDNAIKQQEQFINDENCIVIGDEINLPEIPNDNFIYAVTYDKNTQLFYLERTGNKIVSDRELLEVSYSKTEQVSDDVLLNMEIGADTNDKMAVNTQDVLTLMEMLLSLDEKITQLLQPK